MKEQKLYYFNKYLYQEAKEKWELKRERERLDASYSVFKLNFFFSFHFVSDRTVNVDLLIKIIIVNKLITRSSSESERERRNKLLRLKRPRWMTQNVL